MDAPACVVVDELDDGVGEQGVGERDPIVALDDEGAGVGHAGSTGGGEQVGGGAGEPCNATSGEVLDA